MARPLKIFTVQSHAAYVPSRIINDVIGAPSHIRQGNIYVVARTKKDASAFLGEKLGGRYGVNVIEETQYNHLVAFTDATTYLDTESPVLEGAVAVSWGRGSQTYAIESVTGNWIVVGETTHQDPTNPRKHLPKPIFVPVAAKPKPVRVTIELDADIDPALVEKLMAGTGGSCHVTFGRITEYNVTGKVVQP